MYYCHFLNGKTGGCRDSIHNYTYIHIQRNFENILSLDPNISLPFYDRRDIPIHIILKDLENYIQNIDFIDEEKNLLRAKNIDITTNFWYKFQPTNKYYQCEVASEKL